MSSNDKALAAANSFIQMLNARDYDHAQDSMHPDFVKHPHDGKPDENFQQFLDEYKGIVGQFPDLKSVVKKSIASGDEVWLWTKIDGLPEGFNLEIVEICRIEDGKVREKWDIHQTATQES